MLNPYLFDLVQVRFVDCMVYLHYLSVTNYAMAKNKFPVVHGITIRRIDPENGDFLDELAIKPEKSAEAARYRELEPQREAQEFNLSFAGVFQDDQIFSTEELSFSLASTKNIESYQVNPLSSRVPARSVEKLRETDSGEITFEIRDIVHSVTEKQSQELTILPANYLQTHPAYYQSFASFIRPSDPALASVFSAVSDIMQRNTGSASIAGYQKGTDHALELARAAFEALELQGIRYSEPPRPFDNTGQRIRTNSEVIRTRFGTCIDLSLLYCAILEQCGLHPVIFMVPGHALVGVLREELLLPVPAITEPGMIRNYIASKVVVPIDATFYDGGSFESALESGKRCVGDHSVTGIIGVVDARRDGIRPLILPWEQDTSEIIATPADKSNYLSQSNSVMPTGEKVQFSSDWKREYTADKNDVENSISFDSTDMAPIRVQQWKKELLDLSFRNRLLNLRSSAESLALIIPKGGLAALDDKIHNQEQISLHPKDEVSDNRRLQGVRDVFEIGSGQIAAELNDRNRVYVDVAGSGYKSKLRSLARKAKILREETGSSNLYLTLGAIDLDGFRSPMFLIPVKIILGKGAAANRLAIDTTANATPNYCLVEFLKQRHNLSIEALSSPRLDAYGLDIDYAIEQISRVLVDSELSFSVTEESFLTIAKFATYGMWKDLEKNYETLITSPVFRHLALNPGQRFVDPAGEEDLRELEFDEAQLTLPIPADGAQLRAIAAAGRGRSFVLEGPPGTGKSQTITNLIAHSLDLGKTVLFVAEKQAALDVVKRRLNEVGLGDFTLDLHGSDQKPAEIRKQVQRSIDAEVHYDETSWNTAVNMFRAALAPLAEYPGQIHTPNAAGFSMWKAATALMDMGPGLAAPIPESFLRTYSGLSTDEFAMTAKEAVRHAGRLDVQELKLWSFVGPELVKSDTERERAWKKLDFIHNLLQQQSSLRELVLGTPDLEEVRLRVLEIESVVKERPTSVEQLSQAPAQINDIDRVFQELTQLRSATQFHRATFTPVFLAHGDIDQLKGLATEANTGLFGKKKRREAFFEALQVATNQQVWAVLRNNPQFGPENITPLLEQVRQNRLAELYLKERLSNSLGSNEFDGQSLFEDATVDKLMHLRQQLITQYEYYMKNPELYALSMANRGLIQQVSSIQTAWNDWIDSCGALESNIDDWRGSRTALQAWWDVHPEWVSSIASRGISIITDVAHSRNASQPLIDAGLEDFSEEIINGKYNTGNVELAFHRGVASCSLDERGSAMMLTKFDRSWKHTEVENFQRAARKIREEAKIALPSRILQRRPYTPGRLDEKTSELRRALEAKRQARSFRSLFEQFSNEITAVAPCFLVSPTSLADYIPPTAAKFDLVVFDEASQVTVDQAMGALGRGRAAVIVGDDKQMPPTRFGKSSAQSEEDLYGISDQPEFVKAEGPTASQQVADMESILTECSESGLPRLRLNWHYRSQDESLIAFSNDRYYEGDLASFPTPGYLFSSGLSLLRVDGQFIRKPEDGEGPKGTNTVEARAIIDEITTRLNDPLTAHESIGVVTFNVPQRDLILDLLDECDDSMVQAALERDSDPLFVKNLENVQGDERDVILFSVAFSKKPDGDKLPLNFGPLTNRGGERRLNVAITRARVAVKVFASFDPRDIDLARTSSQGVADLRGFMEAAQGNQSGLLTEQRHVAIDFDRIREAIAEDLRSKGWIVETNFGLSSFRLDLVVRPADDQRWHAAVLLDSPRWAKWPTVSDRDLTPDLLKGMMNWASVERVWLPDFISDRSGVSERLHSVLVDAVEKLAQEDEKRSEMQSQREAQLKLDKAREDERRAAERRARVEAFAEEAKEAEEAGEPIDEVAVIARQNEKLGMVELPNESDSVQWSTEVGIEEFSEKTRDDETKIEPTVTYRAEIGVSVADYVEMDQSPLGEKSEIAEGLSADTKSLIRAEARKMVNAAGPISLSDLRLALLKRFGFARSGAKLNREIDPLISSDLLHEDLDGGIFAWPEDADPAEWNKFRVFPEPRADKISLHEIANVLLMAWANGAIAAPLGTAIGELSQDECEALTFAAAELLGFRRKTGSTRERIALAMPLLDSKP